MAFSPKDMVQVASGGPTMTVAAVNGDNVECVWQERKGTSYVTKRETFPATALKKYERPRPIRPMFGWR